VSLRTPRIELAGLHAILPTPQQDWMVAKHIWAGLVVGLIDAVTFLIPMSHSSFIEHDIVDDWRLGGAGHLAGGFADVIGAGLGEALASGANQTDGTLC
jgi:hypothetical protein